MENKLLKRLTKAYKKRFSSVTKNIFEIKAGGLVLFVEYLKYLRDRAIISTAGQETNQDVDNKTAAIIIALNEFDAYKNSDNREQKEFHWQNFCEFVKLNMEEWLTLNDSI